MSVANIINRAPNIARFDMSPWESLTGKRSDLHYFRVFGSIDCYRVDDSKSTKLDARHYWCIFRFG